MGNIYFQSYAFLSILMIIFIFFTKKRIKNIETSIYSKLLIVTLCALSLDIVIIVVTSIYDLNDNVIMLLKLLNKFYLSFLFFWVSYFSVYTLSLRENKKNKFNKFIDSFSDKYKYIIATIILLIFFLPIDIIKENDIMYSRGAAVTIVIVTTVIHFILLIINLYYNRNNLANRKYIPLYLIFVLVIVNIIVVVFFPDILLTTPIAAFIVMVMYYTIENPDVKMIEQLNITKAAAERANLAKSDFLSSMSHEIRTPLNAIVGLSQDMLDKETLPQEFKEDASDIVNASNTLLEIVGNIIDISKIESDKMETILTEYSIIDIVDSVIRLNETRIGSKNLKLQVTYAKDLPYELYGDKNHLKQVINNLVSNAVKYTEKGYVKVHVKCINKDKKTRLIISIEDTGKGIKKEDLGRLFEKFDRLDAEKNSTIEGTGLGLAITKKLVDILGGKINVQSSYGYGSLFVINVNQKISKMDKPLNEDKKSVINTSNVMLKDKKVLIVDDNILNIKVAKRALLPLEMTIDESLDGKESINMIRKNNYDVILMDIMMPDFSGEEVLKELKKDEKFNTPVIALTADAISGSKKKYIEMGFSSYVAKPFNKDQIKLELEKVLNNK